MLSKLYCLLTHIVVTYSSVPPQQLINTNCRRHAPRRNARIDSFSWHRLSQALGGALQLLSSPISGASSKLLWTLNPKPTWETSPGLPNLILDYSSRRPPKLSYWQTKIQLAIGGFALCTLVFYHHCMVRGWGLTKV